MSDTSFVPGHEFAKYLNMSWSEFAQARQEGLVPPPDKKKNNFALWSKDTVMRVILDRGRNPSLYCLHTPMEIIVTKLP